MSLLAPAARPAPSPTFACRRCGAPVEAGAQAALLASTRNLVFDRVCGACGHRALYRH